MATRYKLRFRINKPPRLNCIRHMCTPSCRKTLEISQIDFTSEHEDMEMAHRRWKPHHPPKVNLYWVHPKIKRKKKMDLAPVKWKAETSADYTTRGDAAINDLRVIWDEQMDGTRSNKLPCSDKKKIRDTSFFTWQDHFWASTFVRNLLRDSRESCLFSSQQLQDFRIWHNQQSLKP